MSQVSKVDLPRIVLVGLVLPIVVALIDRWLLDREFYTARYASGLQTMAFFILQVGLFGVLCCRLIQPPWLLWFLFAWCLLLTDLNAFSSLSGQIAKSLLTAQVGLVTIWIILGTSSWKIRLAVALLLVPAMPVAMVQTASLFLICLVLRSQGFRLALVNAATENRGSASLARGTPRYVQFNIRDVLLWTTALAPLLAMSRLAISEIQQRRALTNGVLHAFVLVVALWAALGRGASWLRWPLSAVFVLLVGLVWADFETYVHHWWGWSGGSPPWFSKGHLEFWLWHSDAFVEFALSGGMLAATLLIYRVLGYRLCRGQPARNPEPPLPAERNLVETCLPTPNLS